MQTFSTFATLRAALAVGDVIGISNAGIVDALAGWQPETLKLASSRLWASAHKNGVAIAIANDESVIGSLEAKIECAGNSIRLCAVGPRAFDLSVRSAEGIERAVHILLRDGAEGLIGKLLGSPSEP